jgi:hypothetical protein
MEVVCDKTIESGDRDSPVSGENMETEANGNTTAAKSAWKPKREVWIKPEETSKAAEDSVMNPDILASAAKDRASKAPRIVLDEDHGHSLERRKSLPPIKVPEKSTEIPIVVSRAVYNRYVLTLQYEVTIVFFEICVTLRCPIFDKTMEKWQTCDNTFDDGHGQ